MANPSDRLTLRRWLLAGSLLCAAQQCAAFGGVGYLGECGTFTTCGAAVGSGASWYVRYAVTGATPDFVPFFEAPTGSALYQGFASVQTSDPLFEARSQSSASSSIDFYQAAGRAQSNFGLNRAEEQSSRGMGGLVLQNALALASANVVVQTHAEAVSAWRDVWSFTSNGHLSGRISVDGTFRLTEPPFLPPTSQLSPIGGVGEWFFDLRVWDVTPCRFPTISSSAGRRWWRAPIRAATTRGAQASPTCLRSTSISPAARRTSSPPSFASPATTAETSTSTTPPDWTT